MFLYDGATVDKQCQFTITSKPQCHTFRLKITNNDNLNPMFDSDTIQNRSLHYYDMISYKEALINY